MLFSREGYILRDKIREENRRFQLIANRATEAWNNGYRLLGGKIHCSDKCCNCCSLAVNCTWPESLSISDMASNDSPERLDGHVKDLRVIASKSPDLKTFLKSHRHKLGACPFLTESSCSIYHDRPFSCRSLLSTKESYWCGADFGQMGSEEKQAFMDSLDREVVAFPTHYIELTREIGQNLETEISEFMTRNLGFSIYGNLPFMVFLNKEYGFEEIVYNGYDETIAFLDRKRLNQPYLISLSVNMPSDKMEDQDSGF